MVILGIGADKETPAIKQSILALPPSITCHIFSSEKYPHPEEALIRALYEGEIDAAVRGTLPSSTTLSCLKRAAGVSTLERIAVLETPEGHRFLLAPVGVDEGWTVEEKCSLVTKARKLASQLGYPDSTAILSGGRIGDLGRHPKVDQSIEDACEVAKRTGSVHAEILIEDAARDYGIIIAPDGISGNLIFRTIALLGAGRGLGAPVVNISRIFVDSSRASSDYCDALLMAAKLSDFKNR